MPTTGMTRLIARLGGIHKLAGIKLDAALREAAGNEKVVREVWKIIHAGFHIGVVDVRNRCRYILWQLVSLEGSDRRLE